MTTFYASGYGNEKVLILPGLFGGSHAFDAMLQFAPLDRYQYVAIEYRGFGAAKGGRGAVYSKGFVKWLSQRSEGDCSVTALAKYAEDAMSTNIESQVEGSDVPFLAVVGRHDPSNTEGGTATTRRLYRHATLEVIDAGHYPMIECPALTMAVVERFHDRIVSPSPSVEASVEAPVTIN